MALAIIGFYASLYPIIKITYWLFPSKPKKNVAAVVSHDKTGEIPSVDSPAFSEWLGQDGNFEKMLTQGSK